MVATLSPEAPPRRSLWVSIGSLIMVMFLAALDQTVVATAMPTIAGELNGLQDLSWVVTAFALASGIVTPLYGKLSDMYGRKTLYLTAIVVFLAGSALCGLAQTMGQLIAFRAFQGLGAGGVMVLTMIIAADLATPRERAKFQGIFGAVFGIASIAGPVVGGYLTEHASWRWIFAINLPLGAIALAVAFTVLKLPRRTSPHRVDWLGAALIAGLLTCLTLLASWGGSAYAWTSPVILGLGAGAVLLTVLFVLVERRVAEPVLPLRLFRDRAFTIPVVAVVLLATAMLGTATFLPLFLQLASGASASDSGLLLLPMMAGMIAASTLGGQIVTRLGHYKWLMVGGAVSAAAAGFLFATMGLETSTFASSAYMVLAGAGIGVIGQNLLLAVQTTTPEADRGAATSAVTFARGVGGAVGVAVLGGVFSGRLGGGQAALTPEAIQALPEGVRHATQLVFSDAITGVFAWVGPIMLAVAVLLACLRNVRLTHHT
ncbi:EmrB/QacA subfamily drug resistance transporter [Nonomuraea fuscirosea]|uniref:EmrB/QacA subfamily drug resistance transporter n=1 Tax=Nonomuraea fuscirosea TaxID=1291556 RepID=A0A2T0MV86_9ACTN|nr:MDR family MFS transporter [Nonomuraea fuscirosea]PRX62730.1 EmrB/QacA subfamily drug resistance transporter [Nonomuraea fuscirosea]